MVEFFGMLEPFMESNVNYEPCSFQDGSDTNIFHFLLKNIQIKGFIGDGVELLKN
jgi:hypothetical protein